MNVTVYFEKGMASHVVAQFESDELYMACLPILEKEASKGGYIITESVKEESEWEIRYDDSGESEIYGEGRWFVADEDGIVLGDTSFHTKKEAEDFLKECLENEDA